MNATELYLADGKATGIYFCEKCRMVRSTKVLAEECCKLPRCFECGKEMLRDGWSTCQTCRDIRRERLDAERYIAAVGCDALDADAGRADKQQSSGGQ